MFSYRASAQDFGGKSYAVEGPDASTAVAGGEARQGAQRHPWPGAPPPPMSATMGVDMRYAAEAGAAGSYRGGAAPPSLHSGFEGSPGSSSGPHSFVSSDLDNAAAAAADAAAAAVSSYYFPPQARGYAPPPPGAYDGPPPPSMSHHHHGGRYPMPPSHAMPPQYESMQWGGGYPGHGHDSMPYGGHRGAPGGGGYASHLPAHMRKPKPKYKTKLCSYFMDSKGAFCPYGDTCQFAHGHEEMRMAAPSRRTVKRMDAKGREIYVDEDTLGPLPPHMYAHGMMYEMHEPAVMHVRPPHGTLVGAGAHTLQSPMLAHTHARMHPTYVLSHSGGEPMRSAPALRPAMSFNPTTYGSLSTSSSGAHTWHASSSSSIYEEAPPAMDAHGFPAPYGGSSSPSHGARPQGSPPPASMWPMTTSRDGEEVHTGVFDMAGMRAHLPSPEELGPAHHQPQQMSAQWQTRVSSAGSSGSMSHVASTTITHALSEA